LKSYFFIPANKKKYIQKINDIDASYIVLDLEDAIHKDELEQSIDNIFTAKISNEHWIRLPFEISKQSELLKLVKNGYYNFIIPKVQTEAELTKFIDWISLDIDSQLRLILLIESPQALVNIKELAQFQNVVGLCFGSHDYTQSMNMKHTLENINWARMTILNMAKAQELEAIDIASMELMSEERFVEECRDGFNKGFDAKFIIHPWQLEKLMELSLYDKSEINLALEVREYIKKIGGLSKFTIYKGQDKIIEKPHLKRIKEILDYNGYESF